MQKQQQCGAPSNGPCSFAQYTKSLRTHCGLFSLQPLAQDSRNRIMDLRRVNQFTPLPPPVLPYLGPETGLVKDTLVSSSEHFIWSKLRLGRLQNSVLGEYTGAARRFHAAHSAFFHLQNAVYFIMLPFLVPVLFTF